MKSSYSWIDLESKFSELSSRLKHARVDAQWGSVPTRLSVIGGNDSAALERFSILSAVAGQKLYNAMGKAVVDGDDDLRNESNPYTFWLKALKKFSGNFQIDYVGEQAGYGSVFTGRLYDIATASANLCLSFSASLPENSNGATIASRKPTKRVRIPRENKVRAELQKEIDSICPFCGNSDVGHFEIHHIDENPSNNEISNLLLLCPTCHSKITKQDITAEEVKSKKASLDLRNRDKVSPANDSTQIVKFHGPVENAIVGNKNRVIIRNSSRKVVSKYPEGSIGSDNLKAKYVSYLITKYHEFQEYQIGKGNMNYAIFPSKLKSLFKIGKSRTINNVPLERFEELTKYIQDRVDGTKLGRIRKKRNQKNYSMFEEYVSQQKR